MTKCASCVYGKYSKSVRPVVQASLAVVGEAPSAIEVRKGTVLDSRGGDVVRNTLVKVGLPSSEKEVFYTTALKCAVHRKSGQTIAKTAMVNCRDTLIEELRASGAEIVIVLGVTAIKTILGDYSVKLREVQGLAREIKELPGVQFITVSHPALILRTPGEYKTFLKFFQYAAQLASGHSEVLDPGITEYSVIRTEEDVINARLFLAEQGLLGCDIETTELSPFHSEQQGRAGTSLVIGIAYAKNKVLGFAKSAIPFMQQIFDLPNMFVWHGGKFDKLYERVADRIDVRIDHDLMLADYALNETSGTHDLEQISMRELGADAYKDEANDWIRSKEGFEAAPEEVQLQRVCVDADYTLQAFEKVYARVAESDDLLRLYTERLVPAANAYTHIEENGMLIDMGKMQELDTKYIKQSEAITKEIEIETEGLWCPTRYKNDTGAKTAGSVFKPTSPKQVSWLVFDRLRLSPKKRQKRSTNAEVLASIPNPPRAIELILQLRSIKKEHGTYVKGFVKRKDENDRVHSNFSLHITATGRRSSTGPNVQNIPSRRPDIRRAFIPAPGRVLVEVDYSAAESRVLAMISGDKALERIFLEGRDIHGELAQKLYGDGYTNVQRGRAKTVNFGVPYGRQAHSIAEAEDMSHAEAQSLIDGWAEMYPDAWAYLQDCADLALQGKSIRSPMGRYKRPGLITPDTIDAVQNEFRNYTIQSTVAEFTLLAVVELQKMLNPSECIIVNEVHDSLVLEMNDNEEVIRRNCELIRETLSSIPKRYLGWELPFTCDVEVGYNWADVVELDEFLAGENVAR